MLRLFRRFHKWPGVVFTLLILLFAVSGIFLNHRQAFSSIDVSRKWLPGVYRYQNWNMTAIKGGQLIGHNQQNRGAERLRLFGEGGHCQATEKKCATGNKHGQISSISSGAVVDRGRGAI